MVDPTAGKASINPKIVHNNSEDTTRLDKMKNVYFSKSVIKNTMQLNHPDLGIYANINASKTVNLTFM